MFDGPGNNITPARDTSSSVLSPSLEQLPPEMRNRIYRATLVRDEPIDVTGKRGLDEPALLAVTKRIRAEAIGMHYSENSFRISFSAASLRVRRAPRGSLRSFEDFLHGLRGAREVSEAWFQRLGPGRSILINAVRITLDSTGEGEHVSSQHSLKKCIVDSPWDCVSYGVRKHAVSMLRNITTAGVRPNTIQIDRIRLLMAVDARVTHFFAYMAHVVHFGFRNKAETFDLRDLGPEDQLWNSVQESYEVEDLGEEGGIMIVFEDRLL